MAAGDGTAAPQTGQETCTAFAGMGLPSHCHLWPLGQVKVWGMIGSPDRDRSNREIVARQRMRSRGGPPLARIANLPFERPARDPRGALPVQGAAPSL